MPFNYDTNLRYQPVAQKTLEAASVSPFDIAGRAMTSLDDALEDRKFDKAMLGAKSLEDTIGIKTRTPEQLQKLGLKQKMFGDVADREYKENVLAETLRHNMATEGGTPKGFGVSVDPITGQSRIYSKDTGAFGSSLGGVGIQTSDSGEPISAKTATTALPDGTVVYANRAGQPLTRDGEPIVKTRSKFNLEKPEEIAVEQQTVNTLNRMFDETKSNPEAIGSMGSGLWNYISNNINDIVQVPTKTNVSRNEIQAHTNTMTTMMRNMVETGVMTDRDFDRYKPNIPSPNDSSEVYFNKLNRLKPELE